jgi:hypothetical protein
MAFDPDAYLAKRLGGQDQAGAAPSAFDPEAYLAARNQVAKVAPGKLESFLRGAKQSATLGFGDELTALGESALGSLGMVPDKTYAQAVAEARANDAAAEQENPWSSGAGSIVGGLATAALPGLGAGGITGATGTMAKLGQAALLGSKLGGISAIGNSEGGDVVDNVKAGLKGAAGGAIGGMAIQGLGMAASKAGQAIAAKLRDAVNPNTQLGLALGATARELNGSSKEGEVFQKAVSKLWDEGLFADAPHGPLDEHLLLQRIEQKQSDVGARIGEEVKKFGDKVLPHSDFAEMHNDIVQQLREIIQKSPPAARASAASDLEQALTELRNTDGKLADIWSLKSRSGGWASKAWTMANQPPPVKEGYMAINQTLNKYLTGETGALADSMGAQGNVLKGLNASYHAAATVEPVLGKLVGKLSAAPSSLGFGARDLGAGGLVAGAAAGMGAGPLAAPLGLAAAAGNQWSRSVPGRVARAQIGQYFENKAAQASISMGAIPRETVKAQAWLQQNFQRLPPQMQQTAAAIVGAPKDRAEQIIRAVIPMFAQHFAKSSYPSELDGQVSTDDDKEAIRKRLHTLQLPSTTMALRLSALNSKGTIPIEAYDPESYAENLQTFVNKMTGNQGVGQSQGGPQ